MKPLIAMDLSKLETRAAKLYANAGLHDPHEETARELFNVECGPISLAQRQHAKTVNWLSWYMPRRNLHHAKTR